MKKPTALGVYIFAGGFTLGVKRAGFRVLAQLEGGPYGVATTRANHPRLPVHTVVDEWPLESFRGAVDFVYGNPPCAPFSNAGVSSKRSREGKSHNESWRTDARVSCIRNMFRVLDVVRPHVWAWESVQPALKKGRPLVEDLTRAALELGYSATYLLVNAVHIGVPQIRRRFFCVFHDVRIPWTYERLDRADWKTVAQAFEPITSGRVANTPDPPPPLYEHNELIPMIEPGGNLRSVWERMNPPETRELNRHGGVLGRPRMLGGYRLLADRPSPTILGGIDKIHPTEHRYVTLMEQQLLCGYPPDYKFVGSVVGCYQQTAQAVMPPVGEWLARNVRAALEAGIPTSGEVDVANLETGQMAIVTRRSV